MVSSNTHRRLTLVYDQKWGERSDNNIENRAQIRYSEMELQRGTPFGYRGHKGVTMIFAPLALLSGALGTLGLVANSVLGRRLSTRASDRILLSALGLTVLGILLGLIGGGLPPARLGLALGVVNLGLCGTAYLLYRRTTRRMLVLHSPVTPVTEPPETDSPLPPDPPRRPRRLRPPSEQMERPEACSARFTRGYEYYRIETTKRTTLHRYRAVHVVTIAWDEFLIFEAEASGGTFYGFWWTTLHAEVGWAQRFRRQNADPTFILIDCLDNCRIFHHDEGSFQGSDGELSVGFDVAAERLDDQTLEFHVMVGANMEGVRTFGFATNIGDGVPELSLSMDELDTGVARRLGAWIAECKVF